MPRFEVAETHHCDGLAIFCRAKKPQFWSFDRHVIGVAHVDRRRMIAGIEVDHGLLGQRFDVPFFIRRHQVSFTAITSLESTWAWLAS